MSENSSGNITLTSTREQTNCDQLLSALAVRHAVAVRGNRTSDGGVASAADRGGISVGHGAELSDPRQRCCLRACLHEPNQNDGDSGSPDSPEIAVAKPSRNAFVGHSYDRARNRVYHCLLLLGSHSGHWRRRLNWFLLQSCSARLSRAKDRGQYRQAAGAVAAVI